MTAWDADERWGWDDKQDVRCARTGWSVDLPLRAKGGGGTGGGGALAGESVGMLTKAGVGMTNKLFTACMG